MYSNNLLVRFGFIFYLIVTSVIIFGCGHPVTKVSIQSFEIHKAEVEKAESINKLTNIFVNRGFDIKVTNRDAGIVTTEYKKFASIGENPPFDYYLQIRAIVRPITSKMSIKLSPIVKGQNRLNIAAFTEEELAYYTGDKRALGYIRSMDPERGYRGIGLTLFNNVVTEVAETFGLSFDDVIKNETKTSKRAPFGGTGSENF